MPHKSDDLKMTAVRHYLEQSHKRWVGNEDGSSLRTKTV